MSEITGSLAADGSSASIAIGKRESIQFTLAVANAESFIGRVSIQRSLNGGASWESAKNRLNEAFEYDGVDVPLTDSIADEIFQNDSDKVALYRVLAEEMDEASDAVEYSISDVAGDVTEAILRDHTGKPVIYATDDGKVQFACGIRAPDLQGQVLSGEAQAITVNGGIERDADAYLGEGNSYRFVKEVTITAAEIAGVAAGEFGHADGVPLVTDDEVGTDAIAVLESAVAVYDRATASYGAGGDTSINENGGAEQTGVISNANFAAAGADKVVQFMPLAADALNRTKGKGLNLVTTVAFTQPGTAAGVIRVRVIWRQHVLGL